MTATTGPSMLDTLFGLIPAESRGQQWLAEDLQVVNWGGYDGAHRIRFASTATLLCGGSGSGKSTLMDAYIALMMPHTTPFNGASNGGVTGRPRGGDQRNILSYGRGKLDESRTGEGTRVRVLRGDGADTWTAVAVTWVDNAAASGAGERFTAVRAWYIPASARLVEDTVKVRGVTRGPFDLADLEQAASHRFADHAVRATGLETTATDREFLARVQSVLGIGAAGAGSKAMNLLARIQAGQQITTVDELYKRMVLEEPETMATADAVVEHFDELEGTRMRMVNARRQVRALEPVREAGRKIADAAERLRLIESVGRFRDPSSPASQWLSRRRLELLHSAEESLRSRVVEAEAAAAAGEASVDAAESERDGLVEVLRSSGGDRLDSAQRELLAAQRRLVEVRRTRERVSGPGPDGVLDGVTDAGSFARLVARARSVLEDSGHKTAARAEYAEARASATALADRLRDLEAEHRAALQSADSIPAELHEARAVLAEAAGADVADLPFVGELVEVKAEFEPWREAFNLALGGFATTMLIDGSQLDSFRTAVNGVRTRVRVRFEGARPGMTPRTCDPGALPGRLDYRGGRFTGWLQDRLERSFGFVCVDDPGRLGEYGAALTVTGQLSRSGGGAHGGHGRRNVLGFSGQGRAGELAQQVAAVRGELEDAADRVRTAEEALDAVDAGVDAYRRVVDLTWEQLDVAAAQAEVDRWQGIVTGIAGGSPEIAALQERIAELKSRTAELREETGRARGEYRRLLDRWDRVNGEIDRAEEELAAADDAGDGSDEPAVVRGVRGTGRGLTTGQDRWLSDRFAAVVPGVTDGRDAGEGAEGPGSDPESRLAGFDAAAEVASRILEEDRDAAGATLSEQRALLRRTMESFLDNWPNPSLRADPDSSLKDFERLLDDLESSGLHTLEAEWKQSLLTLSGNDLTNLDSTLGRALREIRERIEPVNRIMADLPFYDDDHRLQITLRENRSEVRRRFRRELREVRGLVGDARTDGDREQVYPRVARLINRIRRSSPDFADLVDVRNHVRVSAEKTDAVTGEHVALYDHIGEKSGGESQELIAFIVGAALRYQLGDADAPRPRYAPVFLDEALIKADAHFTRRAIGAWRGLGFQLVIGAPVDKYSAIEPHIDAEYDILKDASGRSWAKPKVGLPG